MTDQEFVLSKYIDATCITRISREKSVTYCVISERCAERNEFGVVRGVGVWCLSEEKAWFDAAQRLRVFPRSCHCCGGQLTSEDDYQWHGLNNCVPICEVCQGDGCANCRGWGFVDSPQKEQVR